MLIISHRFSLVKNADYVYVINEGAVVEEGTPKAPIRANGWFAELARQSGEGPDIKPADQSREAA
jgi:ABC-type multidrug transport system fused ATPase/permease subunit